MNRDRPAFRSLAHASEKKITAAYARYNTEHTIDALVIS
jgi:hypothetical protein